MTKTTATPVATPFNPASLNVAKRVTLPVLKQRVGNPIYVQFLEPMEVSKTVAGKADDNKDPAVIAKVYDLVGERPSIIILTAVEKSVLNENYEDDGYVGKFFKLELFAVEGKKYHQVEVLEFEQPEGFVRKD